MLINVGDINCEIVHPRENLKALAIIREVCRARPNGYQFMPKFKRGLWDGYISVMGSFSSYPTGLFNQVHTALTENGFKPEYVIKRLIKPAVVTADTLDGITLRDYQIDAANKLLTAGRGIAKMATNSGKTEVMAAVIKALGFPKTIVFVHRKELLYQTAERFEKRLGMSIGKLGDGINEYQNISVCMIQTFSRKDFPVGGTQLVMVDECHNASSDSYMDCLKDVPGSYRFGFSGTPLKHSVLMDLKLISMTGDVVVEVTNKELIDGEFSAKPEVMIYRLKNTNDGKLGYAEAYDEYIVNNQNRNHLISSLARGASGTVLVLVNRIDHGSILADMIGGATFVNGSHSTEFRRDAIEQMRAGGGIFIASPIFDEGIDIPALDCVILAGGGKSHVKLLQRIGRGLRKKDGDNKLVVYDFDDCTNKYLKAHSRKRQEAYANEQFDVRFV